MVQVCSNGSQAVNSLRGRDGHLEMVDQRLYLISLMHRIIPNWVLAGRLISYFSMTLTVVPLYLLSKDLFNRPAAFWGCIAFILLPETLLHSNSVMRDPPFFLFGMCAVYFAQKALPSKRLVHLLGSALFACDENKILHQNSRESG